jgi:hypothetical protein
VADIKRWFRFLFGIIADRQPNGAAREAKQDILNGTDKARPGAV